MNKFTDTVPDIRFSFNHLKVAPTKMLQEKLEYEINKNPAEFRDVNWVTDSRTYNVSSLKNKKFENVSIGKHLDDNAELANYVKDVLKGISSEVKLDPELVNYVSTPTSSTSNVENQQEITTSNDTKISDLIGESDENDSDDSEDSDNSKNANSYYSYLNEYPKTSEIETFDTFKTLDDSTMYSLIPGRLISFHSACEIAKAVSRVRLTLPKKDDSIKYAEERERLKLRAELLKYMKLSQVHAELEPTFNVDIEQMTLKQLQTYSTEARELYEKMKITDVLMNGIDGIDKIQSTVFKNGIKIPGTKKVMKINNLAGAFKEVLINNQRAVYVAYENLIEKYNLRVSDELLTGLELLSTIFKTVEITDVEDSDEEESNEEENSGSGSEDSDEEEESESE